jgi:hypothetical protein
MDIKSIEYDSVDWFHLAQDMNKWQGVLNTVVNLRFP